MKGRKIALKIDKKLLQRRSVPDISVYGKNAFEQYKVSKDT